MGNGVAPPTESSQNAMTWGMDGQCTMASPILQHREVVVEHPDDSGTSEPALIPSGLLGSLDTRGPGMAKCYHVCPSVLILPGQRNRITLSRVFGDCTK